MPNHFKFHIATTATLIIMLNSWQVGTKISPQHKQSLAKEVDGIGSRFHDYNKFYKNEFRNKAGYTS